MWPADKWTILVSQMLKYGSSDSGKQRRIRPFSRDSRDFRDFRDSRDSPSEKTPFVMTPFPVPIPVFCSMPGVGPHGLHIPWIEHEDSLRKVGMTGFVRDGCGCSHVTFPRGTFTETIFSASKDILGNH